MEAAADAERAPADRERARVGLRAEVILDVLRVAVELDSVSNGLSGKS